MKPNWSASDIPRLNGRVAIVTGANSGVGYEIALQLVLHGAHVVLAARDKGRMEEAVKRIKMTAAEAKVGTQLLDLADLDSVRQFAREFSDQHDGVACREHVQRHCTGAKLISKIFSIDANMVFSRLTRSQNSRIFFSHLGLIADVDFPQSGRYHLQRSTGPRQYASGKNLKN